MAYRRFTDRNGHSWEIRERSRSEWELVPTGDNPEDRKTVKPPGYEADPFELSQEELQRMLDAAPGSGGPRGPRGARGPGGPRKSSPFQD